MISFRYLRRPKRDEPGFEKVLQVRYDFIPATEDNQVFVLVPKPDAEWQDINVEQLQ